MPGDDDIYDAIIIGAGPAGGVCARELSTAGRKVLLVEKAKDFFANDFSSGGSTPETLKTFDLPETLVGSFCKKVKISASDASHLWCSPNPIAVVFNFRKLRSFLADETAKNGSDLLFGWSYQDHETQDHIILVSLKKGGSQTIERFQTKVLVDATGSERKVLSGGVPHRLNAIVGTGIEFLVEVPEDVYQSYSDCLSFFIGQKWMPQGYAWIFPMEANRLKVGVGRNYPNEQVVPHQKSFRFYLDRLMSSALQTNDITILDQHGKTLSYTSHQRDCYFNQNVIAIGDAVSTVNPLTFEGIRHAMMSGRIAAIHVNRILDNNSFNFQAYKAAMRRISGFKWIVSERLTKKIYREADDKKVSLMLAALRCFTLEALIDLVFYYRVKSAFKFYAAYTGLCIKASLKRSG